MRQRPLEEQRPIRVVVVEDSAFMLQALTRSLDDVDELVVVGTARTGREALEVVAERTPDVVLLDLRIPYETDFHENPEVSLGLQVLREISLRSPASRVLVVSATIAPDIARAALREGAHGFLDKSDLADADTLARAIRDTAVGNLTFSPLAAIALREALDNHEVPPDPRLRHLTHHQMQILSLLAEGDLTYAEIAFQLQISVATVKTHIMGIYRELGVQNRLGAIAIYRASKEPNR